MKYSNKHLRKQDWDYGWDAAYFITICTQQRECYFGHVEKGEMNLSHIGIIADVLWHEIKNHAKNIKLGEYIVMPNHVHGILILDGNLTVGTTHVLSPQSKTTDPAESKKTIGQLRFQNQGKNTISSIVGSYKSAVSKHARRLGFDFSWQSRFHDHIIRDEHAYLNISNYIENNPAKWEEDRQKQYISKS